LSKCRDYFIYLSLMSCIFIFFFKQKTAYEIGLGIPAEPLFRSSALAGSKHITLNATGGGFLTASKQFRHGATSKSRSNTASNSRSEERRVGKECRSRLSPDD